MNTSLSDTLRRLSCLALIGAFLVLLVACTGAEPALAPASSQEDDENTQTALQEHNIDEADYDRATSFLSFRLQDLVYTHEVNPQWLDGDQFWYEVATPEGTQFVFVDPEAGVREPAFDHEQLATAITQYTDEEFDSHDLSLERAEIDEQRTAIEFNVGDQRWRCNLDDFECEDADDLPEPTPNSIASPDGSLEAYIEDNDLWVYDVERAENIRLTDDGEERYGYATDSQGWRRSDMPILVWSPDSRRIATYRLDERNVPEMHLLEMREGRPGLESWPYAIPGDSDNEVPMMERVVIDVQNRTVTDLDVAPDHQRTSNCCGLTRGQDWADIEWSEDGETLAFVSTSRDYKTVTLRIADPVTGEVRDVYEETVETFFESNLQSRGVPNWRVLHDSDEFIWFTRAEEGWGHLYLHDLQTGERKEQLTSGDWNVLDVLEIDQQSRSILFSGVGREANRDPYLSHLYNLNMDSGDIQLLSEENAHHAFNISPSGNYIVNTFSRYDSPGQTVVRNQNGQVVLSLETADISRLEDAGWNPPESFTVKARDGETDLYGMLYKPSDFDETKSYPIINSIYPGPQTGSIGTRGFSTNRRGQAHALAELGFIVVQIDALGTPYRSKDFHTAWLGNMNDNGLPDQKAGMEQLADRYDWIDLDRAGMYGHSGGGYATAAALFQYPEFFKVGVSSAGNHDNRGYTYYWGEKYQGLRTFDRGDSFANQSNVADAGNLEGKLLISYGTMDSNVHPNMTLQVIDELIRQNKDFDVIVMPNRGHGYASENYHIRRTWDYFVEHLLGEEPPRHYDIQRN